MKTRWSFSLTLIVVVLSAVAIWRGPLLSGSQAVVEESKASSEADASTDAVPGVSVTSSEYPPGTLGDVVRLGEELVKSTSTHPLTKPFVGNQLNCTSCHLDAGTHSTAASFVGVAAAYPAFAPRENAVITLEDRILNCFIRSQNGKRPPNGGKVSTAIATYITWLSRGTPIAMNPKASLGPNHLTMLDATNAKPNLDRGKILYESRCADCHAINGSGSEEGPPVWGPHSFNDGAGLTEIPKMASWLKVAMPLDDADLTASEAFDLAAFINSQPRPKFKVVAEK